MENFVVLLLWFAAVQWWNIKNYICVSGFASWLTRLFIEAWFVAVFLAHYAFWKWEFRLLISVKVKLYPGIIIKNKINIIIKKIYRLGLHVHMNKSEWVYETALLLEWVGIFSLCIISELCHAPVLGSAVAVLKIQSAEEPLNPNNHFPGRNAMAQWDDHV